MAGTRKGSGAWKASLAAQIAQTIKSRGLTQVQAAGLIGVDQPKVSALLSGRLHGFSTQRLLVYAQRLGIDLKITVGRSDSGKSRVRVSVASIGGPTMTSRLLVDAGDFKRWADSSLEIQSLFPELIRRLVHATGKQIIHSFFSAGKSVQLPGWDGTLVSEAATAFIPMGASGWEFGTDAKPKPKADKDYKKRTGDPLGLIPASTTFIFVTPRVWPKKDEWVVARRNEGIWKDVRAYDARNLEEWLHLAPAVHVWISRHLGKRPEGVDDLTGYWSDWSQATTPNIPPGIVTAGRDNEVKRVRAWCDSPKGEVLTIVADTQKEAVAFFAAALVGIDEDKYRSIAARTIIVEDERAWEGLVSSPSGLILLPLFSSPEAVAKAARSGHAVLLPRGRGESASPADALKLRPIRPQDAVKIWMDAGVDHQRAEQLARTAHNGLAVLRRQLSHAPPPDWAKSGQWRVFVGAMLAGSWNDGSEPDRRVVSALAGVPYDDVITELNRWTNESDPPVRRANSIWSITNKSDAWYALRQYLEVGQLDRFCKVAVEVLGIADPQYDLPDSERWMAAIHGKVPPHSKHLREGLAQSLAMLGARGDDVAFGNYSAADYAAGAVRLILEAANKDWRIWASISQYLPLLAEAAPDKFIDAVRIALHGDEPLGREFFRDSSTDWIGGASSPHTGLLWSLETLARSPDYVAAACQLLARLTAIDPGGRLGNRPRKSLRSIFLPWMPQTAAPVDRRLTIIDQMRGQYPEVAWALMISLLPRSYDTGDYAPPPTWRSWPLELRQDVPVADVLKTAEEITQRAIEDAGSSGARWVALIEALNGLPRPQHEAVVSKLSALDPTTLSDDDRTAISDALREFVSRHRSFSDTDWALPAEVVDRLAALQARFAPNDPVRKFAYLFGHHPQMLDGREKDLGAWQRSLDAARTEALRAITSERGADGVLALARMVERPDQVGDIAGRAALLEREEDLILESFLLADGAEGKLASGFCWGCRHARGRSWAIEKAKGPGRSWSARHRGRLLAMALPTDAETWTLAAELGADVEAAYWEFAEGWGESDQSVVAAAAQYMAHGRAKTAVDILGMHFAGPNKKTDYSPEFIAGALEAASQTPDRDSSADSMFAYYTAELIAWLDESGFDPARVARLEWVYLPVFNAGHRKPKALPRALSQFPELFVELLSAVFRAEGAEAIEPTPEQKQRAHRAHDVLNAWRTLPGADEHGAVTANDLFIWVEKARRLAAAAGRASIGDYMIGEMLSGSPPGKDGAWPHEAVRDVIERVQSERLDSGIEIGKYNARGAHCRAPGGSQELALAAEYAAHAAKCADRWPRTAALLREMERKYKGEARWHDAREQIDD